jgi:hypothetical protein
MKALFACLMCFVFASSQTYAISGGPWEGTGRVGVTGTYSGVLRPNEIFSPGSNSIALFTFNIPDTGLGTGTVFIFAAGLSYSGTITASADPDSAIVTGEIDATSTVDIMIGDESFVETASGSLNAKVKLNRSQSTVRLKGIRNENNPDAGADIQFALIINQPFSEVIYDVIGFKQA